MLDTVLPLTTLVCRSTLAEGRISHDVPESARVNQAAVGLRVLDGFGRAYRAIQQYIHAVVPLHAWFGRFACPDCFWV